MRLLVVGSGGREHALVEALSRSPQAEEIFAAPGNPGMASVAELVDIPVDDLISLRNFARTVDIDLTIVGPEAPLVGGIAEAFWEAGLKIFGPSRGAARIEGSKIFAKKIMQHAGVPTARSEAFDREAAALDYLRSLPPGDGYPVVVKVDGLAAGKGVMIADSYEEAEDAVRDVFDGAFGAAGERLILEEYLRGKEASVLALTDGRNILPFVPAQDYKRLEDGGEGPNTGGMGAYSPTMWMDSATYMTILEEIINPTVHQLALIGAPYTGLLYAGVMITDEGPKALEFNCRFGSLVRDHDAGVQEARVGRADEGELVYGRVYDLLQDRHVGRGVHPHRRGVRPHTARVRSLAAVFEALVVLGRHVRQYVASVGESENGGLLAPQVLLEYQTLPRRPKRPIEHVAHGILGLLIGVCDHNALARRQAVHLDDDGVAVPRGKRAEVGERRCFPVEGLRAGGWDAGVLHDLFGKDLRTLDARRATRGTKDLQTSLPESLSDPADERRLRTHNGEVYVDRSGEVTQ